MLIAFTLFRPGFWMDMVVPPFNNSPPGQLAQVMGELQPGQDLRMQIDGFDDVGSPRSFVAVLPVPEGGSGDERLANAGLELTESDGQVLIINAAFDSIAEKAGLAFDQKITGLLVPSAQPWKQLMFIPALALLLLIGWHQRRRGGLTGAVSERVQA